MLAGGAAGGGVEWDTAEMFTSDEVFLEERAAFEENIAGIEEFRGRLGESAGVMRRCLERRSDFERRYLKMAIYAMMALDKDLRNADAQKLRAETQRVGVLLSEKTSWVEPEILDLGSEKVDGYLAEDPGLEQYAVFLRDVVRRAKHTLPAEQEALLAKVGLISNKFSAAYQQLTTSDMPFPTLTLEGVGDVTLSQTGYVMYRGSADRSIRKQVFSEFWAKFADYENTLGTLLDAEVQKNWFYASSRGYASSLAAYLDDYNIPEEVYTQLIEDTHRHLPLLHRMLRLRQRMLGLDSQGYHDVYASIIPSVDMEYPWEESKTILKRALWPLGDGYIETMSAGLDSWVDVYPADGKRSGAYSAGGWYDGHPWILLNCDASYDSLSTTAHEFGHAMHSRLSTRSQPYPTSSYGTMVAEVASTFNEYLLQHHLLADDLEPEQEVFLLGGFLERVRQTVFRQAMFAEFQLEMHRRAEAGQTLTGESLSRLYLELLRTYHGHDGGVMEIDELYAVEWAYIPHFYRGFYVYQYATGMVASIALAEQVLSAGPDALESYLGFLSSGSSDYPVDLLRKAGADLTTSRPFEIAMAATERALDRIEHLLEQIESVDGSVATDR